MKTIKAVCIGNGHEGSQMSKDFKVGETYEFRVDDCHYNYIGDSYSFTESLFNKYFKVGHPHADLMAKAAEIAKTDCEWWKHFEVKGVDKNWREKNESTFMTNLEYRLKPKTITIGKYEVPEPVREPLKEGDIYFVASPNLGYVYEYAWIDCKMNTNHLNNGLIHLTQEAAETHYKALLQWTMKDE